MIKEGPSFRYFVEPSKSILVVKKEHLQEAKDAFADMPVEIVLSNWFLG